MKDRNPRPTKLHHFERCTYRDAAGAVHVYDIPSLWLMGFCQSILAENPQAHPKACMLAAVQHWHEQEQLEAEKHEQERTS